MGDYHLHMAFEIEADRSGVLPWLTTTNGIAGWWSDTVAGEAGETGDTFVVAFPDSPVDFELAVANASRDRVEWFVADNPPWWQGTTIRFDLADSEEGGTQLLFSHRGFEPDDPIIAAITPAWVRFLDNLVAVAESGQANPAVVN